MWLNTTCREHPPNSNADSKTKNQISPAIQSKTLLFITIFSITRSDKYNWFALSDWLALAACLHQKHVIRGGIISLGANAQYADSNLINSRPRLRACNTNSLCKQLLWIMSRKLKSTFNASSNEGGVGAKGLIMSSQNAWFRSSATNQIQSSFS